jgi:hypothetical protein
MNAAKSSTKFDQSKFDTVWRFCRFFVYIESNSKNLLLVEAAGVEPASEKTSNRELSCFFTFIFVSSSTLRTDKDAATTSLIDLVRPAQTEQGRPAYCATIGTGP